MREPDPVYADGPCRVPRVWTRMGIAGELQSAGIRGHYSIAA
jgi:hypothetical protein